MEGGCGRRRRIQTGWGYVGFNHQKKNRVWKKPGGEKNILRGTVTPDSGHQSDKGNENAWTAVARNYNWGGGERHQKNAVRSREGKRVRESLRQEQRKQPGEKERGQKCGLREQN